MLKRVSTKTMQTLRTCFLNKRTFQLLNIVRGSNMINNLTLQSCVINNKDLGSDRVAIYSFLFLYRDHCGYITFSCEQLLSFLGYNTSAGSASRQIKKALFKLEQFRNAGIIESESPIDSLNAKYKDAIRLRINEDYFSSNKKNVKSNTYTPLPVCDLFQIQRESNLRNFSSSLLLYVYLINAINFGYKKTRQFHAWHQSYEDISGKTGLTIFAVKKGLTFLESIFLIKRKQISYATKNGRFYRQLFVMGKPVWLKPNDNKALVDYDPEKELALAYEGFCKKYHVAKNIYPHHESFHEDDSSYSFENKENERSLLSICKDKKIYNDYCEQISVDTTEEKQDIENKISNMIIDSSKNTGSSRKESSLWLLFSLRAIASSQSISFDEAVLLGCDCWNGKCISSEKMKERGYDDEIDFNNLPTNFSDCDKDRVARHFLENGESKNYGDALRRVGFLIHRINQNNDPVKKLFFGDINKEYVENKNTKIDNTS